MTSGRRAGEPDVPARPAGTPEDEREPAGRPAEPREPRPATDPAEPDATAEQPARDPAARGREAEHAAGSDLERDIDAMLENTQRERDEYLELAQRTRADFENYRRRAAQESEEAGRRARIALARELVPSLDNLERALRAAGVDPDSDEATDGEGLTHGVLLVYRDLRGTLERAGVQTYDPTGERFDPTWHEALATRAVEGTDPGVVLETIEKGYRLDGQVLRAARVVVSE